MRRLILAMAIMATAFVPTAAYATTDPPPSGCTSGDVCLYENAGFGGIKLEWVNPTHAHGCYSLVGGSLDNKVSSIKNLVSGGWRIELYTDGSCGNVSVNFGWGDTTNLAGSGMNDSASSFSIMTIKVAPR